ncbi:MAG TPA: hypothetical protein VD884_09785 [Ohtaekwangia sp.]|nr:hypothetical protein [Ohtaekwangia sp.]
MQHKIDINNGRLFPFHFLILGVIFIFIGFPLLTTHLIGGLSFLLAGVFILTAREGVEINTNLKTLKEYNAYFFIKTGEVENYDAIERIFINANKVAQKMYTAHTLNSSTFSDVVYSAFLKFDTGTKVLIQRNKNKEMLIKNVQAIASKLNTQVFDTTV